MIHLHILKPISLYKKDRPIISTFPMKQMASSFIIKRIKGQDQIKYLKENVGILLHA